MPRYCPRCGRENMDTSRFCNNCGNPLQPYNAPQNTGISQNNNLNTVLIILVSVLAAVIILFLCIYIGYRKISSESGPTPSPAVTVSAEPSVTPLPTAVPTTVPTAVPQQQHVINIYGGDQTGGYIIPSSSTSYLTEGDLRGMSDDQLTLARNEIYARHGRRFQTDWIQNYFNSCSWYSPNPYYNYDNEASMLNNVENYNANFIREYQGL